MIANEPVSTVQLERSKVSVSAYIEKTRLVGSAIEAETAFDHSMKSLVVRLEAILYGRDLVSDTVESNPITVEVFDPDNIRDIPATWWDHLKLDLSTWIYRCSLHGWWQWRDFLENLNVRLRHRITMVPAPQSHRPRTIIQDIHHRKVTAVCPHIGAQVKIDRHLQFVYFKKVDPFTALNVDMSIESTGDAHPLENTRSWREHRFRHCLLEICDAMNNQFGPNADPFSYGLDGTKIYNLLMEIKDLFDRYGVGA